MKLRQVLTAITICAASLLNAQTVRFMPQWTPQAQFAGYYVALEKGFYSELGLDVKIEHIGSNSSKSVFDHLVTGNVNIAGEQLLNAIQERSNGAKIINVMQLLQESALCCVSNRPISSERELEGKQIGRWLIGYENFGDALESIRGIKAEWISAFNPINLFLYGAVDYALCTTYNELPSIIQAKGNVPEENIVRFSEHGFDCPEDGLYVMEDYYKKNKAVVDKFVAASKRGWDYVRDNREEALQIVMKVITENHVVTNEMKQKMMIDEVLRLSVNRLTDEMDYERVQEDIFNSLNRVLEQVGAIPRKVAYEEMIKAE